MFAIKYSVSYLILLNILLKCRGLEKISTIEDTTIKVTESIIRKTTNKIFATLNIKGVRDNQKIRQFVLTHSFMVSVTMRDHKTHNAIIKLSRVNPKANNETKNLVKLINDILNENLKDSDTSNEELLQYVDGFLAKLKGFKKNTGYNDAVDKLSINQDVLRILDDINTRKNVTAYKTVPDDEEVLDGDDIWEPEKQTRRIYQGEKTKIKYFPFMASIQMFNNFQCGGSIIKSDLVLTAASCLQLAWNNRFYRENPAFLSVRVGSNFYKGGGEHIPIVEVYFHPEYDPKNLRNNICVLRLLRRLKFRKKRGAKVKRIEIDRNASPLPMTSDGITIIGWGATSSSNIIKNPFTNRLSYAVLDVYHLQECQEIYSREYVSRTNFCAGFISKGGGACNHDVGGPGIVSGVLAGVVSFGSPVCGTPDAPTVFTKVGYYADWIDEIMEMDVPYIKKRTTLRTTPYRPIFTKALPHASTTFKMEPMMDNWVPGDLDQPEDSLRLLENEDLFKDFLRTMFPSQEAKDYTDLLNSITLNKARDNDEVAEAVDEDIRNFKEGKNSVTKLDPNLYYEGDTTKAKTTRKAKTKPKEKRTDPQTTYNSDDLDVKTNINEPIRNNPVLDEYIVNDEEPADKKVSFKLKKRNKKDKNVDKVEESPKTQKRERKDDEVLTLLYLSNEENPEKIGKIIEDFDENFSDGLTIPLDGLGDGLRDLTYRNNKTSEFNYLSRSELYDLFSEAVRKNGTIK